MNAPAENIGDRIARAKALAMVPDLAASTRRGEKRVTRRLVEPGPFLDCEYTDDSAKVLSVYHGWRAFKPNHKPGDVLWIRERARVLDCRDSGYNTRRVQLRYEADGEEAWVPYPRHLVAPVVGRCIPNGVHREGARTFVEVVHARLELLQDITEEDAKREGIPSGMAFSVPPGEHPHVGPCLRCGRARSAHIGTVNVCPKSTGWTFTRASYRGGFAWYWDGLAKPGAKWTDNPLIQRVEFKLLQTTAPAFGGAPQMFDMPEGQAE